MATLKSTDYISSRIYTFMKGYQPNWENKAQSMACSLLLVEKFNALKTPEWCIALKILFYEANYLTVYLGLGSPCCCYSS